MSTSKNPSIEFAKKLLCQTLMARNQLDLTHMNMRETDSAGSNQRLVNDIEKAINAALTLGIGIGEALPR